MSPALPCVWQNKPTPTNFDANKAHQKIYLLPATPRSYGLTEKTTLHSGIFQINLCYPTGIGTADIEARGKAIQEHFKGQKLALDGVTVQVRGMPAIAAPVSTSPYVVPVSIRYQSITKEA
jgi:hypothetical protein